MLEIKDASLDIVCGITSTLPDTRQPEIAFAGKSNVGKSTLINALMNRKSLARTGSQPGKTQTINFYHINQSFYLVDLPGYGYTRASLDARKAWGRMTEHYLHTSRNLKAVFLLIDSRHRPSENDRMMIDWIRQSGFPPIVIATKADKLNRSERQKQYRLLQKEMQIKEEEKLYFFSGLSREGRDEILNCLSGFL